MTAVASDRQESTFAILARTPRIYVLASALTVGGACIGIREVARWQFLQDAFGGPWGIGIYASLAAVATAVAGLLTGRLVDRHDARVGLVAGLALASAMSLVSALWVSHGSMPLPLVILTALVDGITLGTVGPSLLKTQAAIVVPGAAGSAEILNILRLGIGGVAGAILGGMSPSPAFALTGAGVGGLVLCAILAVILWPVRMRTASALARTGGSLVDCLRALPALRLMVVIDLALAVTIPTQLVNLVLASENVPQLVTVAISSGMVGVLVGRLALFWRGFRDRARTVLLVTTVTVIVMQVLTAVAMIDRWLLHSVWAVVVIITVASIMCAYSVGFTSAVIQRGVPEDVRGRLSGVLIASRSVLIAFAAIAGSAVAVEIGSQGILLVLAGSLALVVVLSRGFRGLTTLPPS